MEAALNSSYGRVLLGATPYKIGRAPDNSLVISDPQSSAYHVELAPGPNGYQVMDMGSMNGTFVNEQRLPPRQPRPLNPGDVLRIGSSNFTYEVRGEGYIATVAAGSAPAYEPTMMATPYTPQAVGYGNVAPPPPSPYPPQAGYPVQPGYPQQPGAFAPGAPSPAKKSSRGLIIVIAVVALLVLIGIGAGAYAFVQSRPSPQKTLSAYCNDLKSGDYQGLYNLYSARSRKQLTEPQFAQILGLAESGEGGVKNCTVNSVTQTSSTTANGSVTYTFGNGKTQTDSGPLILEDGQWKLDSSSSGTNN